MIFMLNSKYLRQQQRWTVLWTKLKRYVRQILSGLNQLFFFSISHQVRPEYESLFPSGPTDEFRHHLQWSPPSSDDRWHQKYLYFNIVPDNTPSELRPSFPQVSTGDLILVCFHSVMIQRLLFSLLFICRLFCPSLLFFSEPFIISFHVPHPDTSSLLLPLSCPSSPLSPHFLPSLWQWLIARWVGRSILPYPTPEYTLSSPPPRSPLFLRFFPPIHPIFLFSILPTQG